MFKFLEVLMEIRTNMFLIQRNLYKLTYVDGLGLTENSTEKEKEEIYNNVKFLTKCLHLNLIDMKPYKDKEYLIDSIEVFLQINDLVKDIIEDIPSEYLYINLLNEIKENSLYCLNR